MEVTVWLLGLCLLVVEALGQKEFFRHWRENYLSTRISFRLVKKSWRPLGPSSTTDEYLDEYKWDLETAFQSMLKSKYEYVRAVLEDSDKLFLQPEAEYDKTKESIFIFHPAMGNADISYVKATINALAMRNMHRKYNVFAVDMPVLNFNIFLSVMKNILYLPTKNENVAEVVAKFMISAINQNMLKPSQIHLVGFSYSAQLVGYIARYIYLLYDQKINTIVSLDPYTNSFNKYLVHVSRQDAEVVHVYHTNSAVCGTRERMGTADFVFNNGHRMPECRGMKMLKSVILPLPNFCSHRRVVQRWWYLILYPSKFVARKCDSWNRLESCDCENNETTNLSYPILNRDVTGTHYLRTSGGKPYGLGKAGAECHPDSRTKLRERKLAEKLKHNIPDLKEEKAAIPEKP